MNPKKITLGLIACLSILALSFFFSSHKTTPKVEQGTPTNDQIQTIIDRGVLRVGVKQDVPNFGYRNPDTNEFEGMEIDIARAIADELGVEIEFTPVTAQTRGPLLDNGQVDIVIATFTITEE